MGMKATLWVTGIVAVAGLAAVIGYRQMPGTAITATTDIGMLATPEGLTLQQLGGGPRRAGFGGGAAGAALGFNANRGTIYADARGMTLYTYDKDIEPGKSSCYEECAKAWPPALAAADAKPFGPWSLVTRTDGAVQWAFQGKPLYGFANDTVIGEDKGNGAANIWHTAMFKPDDGIALPSGLAVQEVADAEGRALVDDTGKTLYAFDGDARRDRAACSSGPGCISHWLPVAAPELANPIGDFSVVGRDDGTKQWAYKSKPLYSFDGDLEPGDANGQGVERQWRVATVTRYFMPAGVTIQHTLAYGAALANGDGLTLYRLNSYAFRNGGHAVRAGITISPAVGREIGPQACGGECLKTWHPFVAPADARPSGFWEVVVRSDGSRQWSYKGYPLYTYAGDKRPGEMMGHDIWDIQVDTGLRPVADTGGAVASFRNAKAIYWSYAFP